MASVTLKNVYKKYENGIKAVTDFNLDTKDGEIIVFLGPSGCGKTTTLRMIAGLETISDGEIYIDGKLINGIEPKDRGIALVFQNYALFPHMTVFENIAFGLKPLELSEDEIKEKVEETARLYDITHLLERKPHQLSSGQKQRVALARAMVREHKILLLDEPLTNLDLKLRLCMRIELMKIHQQYKTTYIYVTHNQEEAMAIADRIVIMKDGIIQQIDTPVNLYKKPCNIFVAGFLGSPQMNFWETKVIEQDGDIYVNLGETKIKLPEAKADKASAYIGKEVWAAVRPEDLYQDEANINKFKDSVIEANVDIREFTGDTIYLYCNNEKIINWNNSFTVRSSADCTAQNGDKIKIAVNPDKIHLFDKDTENTITN